jgi:hypothetical protein
LQNNHASFPRSSYIHIGDELQLGVQNMLDIARGTTFDDQLYINYAVKAIKRSILELEIARSRPVYALTENLRAHLALTELASQLYYKGEVTAKRTADKFKLSEAFVAVNRKLGYFGKEPLIFFNVVDAHAQQIGHTLSKQIRGPREPGNE